MKFLHYSQHINDKSFILMIYLVVFRKIKGIICAFLSVNYENANITSSKTLFKVYRAPRRTKINSTNEVILYYQFKLLCVSKFALLTTH